MPVQTQRQSGRIIRAGMVESGRKRTAGIHGGQARDLPTLSGYRLGRVHLAGVSMAGGGR